MAGSEQSGRGAGLFRVNELFYSLQGEGFFTGTPAIFVRFSGCNLHCPFCDTQHQQGRMMSQSEICEAVAAYPARHVVITGGEPSLQLTGDLVDALHEVGKFVAIETNGTHQLPPQLDWVTLSPKDSFVSGGADVVLTRCDELKLVFAEDGLSNTYDNLVATHRFVQPCDTGDASRNAHVLHNCIEWCLAHPQWRLSLQTHKLIGVR